MPSETMIGGSAQETANKLLDAQGEIVQRAAVGTDQVIESIRRQPVTAALIIFGIGYLFGKIT